MTFKWNETIQEMQESGLFSRPFGQQFDPLVIEKGVNDDEFYEGLVEVCKTFLDKKEFKEALITVKQLISIQSNREFIEGA
jgi:hypothetical protein